VKFVDEITLEVHGGDGGDGSTAMRREKYRPLAGPAGGDGGKGGDVVLRADPQLTTLLDLKYRRVLRAKAGEHGRGRDQYGRGGEDMPVRVPVGTQIFDAESQELLVDLHTPGEQVVIAKGGRGGRGNLHFANSVEQAPMRAEPGEPGEHRTLRLELKLLADVGLIGFPNVGKSTLISSVSKARPKVADYPFTTLVPQLGVVSRGLERSFVMADIPGIIEGAAEGAGLGHRFLKHVERTRVLVHIVTLDPTPGRELLADHRILCAELQRFDPELAQRPMLTAVSKLDLPEVREALPAFQAAMAEQGIQVHPFCAATREGVEALLDAIEQLLQENPVQITPRAVPLARPARRSESVDDEGEGEAEAEVESATEPESATED
jgi:GTP-binding protein